MQKHPITVTDIAAYLSISEYTYKPVKNVKSHAVHKWKGAGPANTLGTGLYNIHYPPVMAELPLRRGDDTFPSSRAICLLSVSLQCYQVFRRPGATRQRHTLHNTSNTTLYQLFGVRTLDAYINDVLRLKSHREIPLLTRGPTSCFHCCAPPPFSNRAEEDMLGANTTKEERPFPSTQQRSLIPQLLQSDSEQRPKFD